MFFCQVSDKMRVTKVEKIEIDRIILERWIIFFNKQLINVPLRRINCRNILEQKFC